MVLELDMDVSRGMIAEKAPSSVHLVVDCLSGGCEQSALGAAYEVVDRDLLPWDEMIILQHASSVTDNGGLSSWCRTSMLLSELAGGTFRRILDLTGGLVKVSLVVASSEHTGSQQELNPLEAHVTKSIVPAEQLLLRFGEVKIVFIDSSDGRIEAFGGLRGCLSVIC